MNMFLYIIMTTPDAKIEITPTADHNHCNLKQVMKKPKLSLIELYKLKKFLEAGYSKLSEAPLPNVQSNIENSGQKVLKGGKKHRRSHK